MLKNKSKASKDKARTENRFAEDRYEIRLSGSGGQGLITAGVILAEAIAVGDGKNTAQTQSYGPEARGGRTRCDVIISNGDIYFPEAVELDLLLALTQESADAYLPLLKPTGILILDDGVVKRKPDRAYVAARFEEEAIRTLGSAVATNIVCLGFIAEYTEIVSKKSLEISVLSHFAKKYAEKNKKALKLGFELAKQPITRSTRGAFDESLDTEIDRI